MRAFRNEFYISTNLGEGRATKDKWGDPWQVSMPHICFLFYGDIQKVKQEILRRCKSYNLKTTQKERRYIHLFGKKITDTNKIPKMCGGSI